jgi:DNA-directed RNA polymerase specialized sigma24 family protein
MAPDGSVTRWLGQLQAGDPAAARPLWERYFRRLVELAHRKLRGARPRHADEEDVALSAFESFCRNAAAGRFPGLQDRDNLWKLLVVLTARKTCHLVRDEQRLKRGGGRQAAADELELLIDDEPGPAFAAEVAETCHCLLEALDEPGLRTVALLKMDGHTNEEIAAQLNCAPRTVERRLRLIRGLWEKAVAP